jgi:hypothetical protein
MTRWLAAGMVAAAAIFCLGTGAGASAQQPATASAAALHAKRLELQPQLQASSFGERLVLSSRELSDQLVGDVYAEVTHPFADLGGTFRTPAGICELLFLHLNVRSCTPSSGADGDGVALLVGPKRAGAAGMQYRMSYAMRAELADAAYLRVTLSAAQGPLSTRDYRMVFEVVPIDDSRSFVHFGYAYGYGTLAKMAMGAYLATAGRDKIGFTAEGKDADGRPIYVRGERAAVERNVMRYYLALLAHSSVRNGTREEQLQARLRAWFALTERYAAQLHEYDLAEYLQEKRDDLARSDTAK